MSLVEALSDFQAAYAFWGTLAGLIAVPFAFYWYLRGLYQRQSDAP